jgi:gentisate 1,2-dioxygenase
VLFLPIKLQEIEVASERMQKLEGRNLWNELVALRDEQRVDRASAVQVVRRKDLPLESNPQGQMRWYMHPALRDIVLKTLSIYEQELPPRGRSGRLQFQGGQIMFIIEGTGYTLIDGVKYPWKLRDVLNLPTKKDGIIVQHFNTDEEKPARFLIVEPNLFAATGVDRGCGFEQLENAPDYRP